MMWLAAARRSSVRQAWPVRIGAIVGVVVVLALGAACGSGGGAGGAQASGGPGDTVAGPAPAGEPTPGGPRILVGGDSVAASLVPALSAATGHRARVDYLAAATISTTSDRLAWAQGIEARDPDLVIVLVGPWEVLQPGFAPTEPGWATTYAGTVLDPLAADLTAGGARVLWIEMHSATTTATTLSFAVLGSQVRELAARRRDVDVLDSGDHVDLPGDVLADVLPGADGTPERIRRLDGTGVHLCPAGVVRLATPVLEWLAAVSGDAALVAPGWEDDPWSRPPALPKPHECPPASATAEAVP